MTMAMTIPQVLYLSISMSYSYWPSGHLLLPVTVTARMLYAFPGHFLHPTSTHHACRILFTEQHGQHPSLLEGSRGELAGHAVYTSPYCQQAVDPGTDGYMPGSAHVSTCMTSLFPQKPGEEKGNIFISSEENCLNCLCQETKVNKLVVGRGEFRFLFEYIPLLLPTVPTVLQSDVPGMFFYAVVLLSQRLLLFPHCGPPVTSQFRQTSQKPFLPPP